ncbi:MAG: MarR family transcriptional regulator, temperature-dependent positive regulator of motility [Chloroflexota bacterium]|jgi:DNA-binding MarR family transcriptional regulator|nr:MarR family transcriptional regulator, temperature-dependent positive regulator of motility [Chloroflexota bacterium]
MDYLGGGNDSHLVLGSGEKEMESGTGTGLITLLTRVSKALHKRTPEAVLGMKWRDSQALGFMLKHEGLTQQELGDAMLMDDNTVVLLLNELEAAGFSVRRRDPGDRRRHIVEITPAGKRAIERAEKAQEGIEDELLGDLDQEERATLTKLLTRVMDGLLKAPVEH